MLPNLCAEMARAKITKADIARVIGKSPKTVYEKIKTDSFLYKEAVLIRDNLFPDLSLNYLFNTDPIKEG